MTKAEERGLEAYPVESHEMYDDMYKQRNAYVKGYEKGYQEALAHIKSEVEQRIAAKEKYLEEFTLEDYVSSRASKEHNIKVGLTIVRNLIDKKINNKSKTRNKVHFESIED